MGSYLGFRMGGSTAPLWRQFTLALRPKSHRAPTYPVKGDRQAFILNEVDRWKALSYVREASAVEVKGWKHLFSGFMVLVPSKLRLAIDYSWIGEAL